MMKQPTWSLLIFCAVLSQGIAVFLNEDNEESSALHIRKKRVIDKLNYEDRSIFLKGAAYIVNIQKNHISVCAGTILSAVFVIAPRHCVLPSYMKQYTILSGSNERNGGYPHNITNRRIVEPNPKLVLLEASPHIDFIASENRPISLFLGALPHNIHGIFSGWGCIRPGPLKHDPVYPKELMQTRLYIIPLEECRRLYHRRIFISNKDICTLDTTKRRGTCIGDWGGPLAVQFPPLLTPLLIGIMTDLRGKTFGEDPEIFINLNHHDINHWLDHVVNNRG